MALTAPSTHRRQSPRAQTDITDLVKQLPERPVTRHPLYEIQDQANALEREIIGGRVGSTEVLVGHLLKMTGLVRALLAVAIAEMEVGRG